MKKKLTKVKALMFGKTTGFEPKVVIHIGVNAKSSQEARKKVEVIEEGELEILPKTKARCDKCGHNMAYFWLVQTRAGDEPETKFLKCEKCGHTWRDYD